MLAALSSTRRDIERQSGSIAWAIKRLGGYLWGTKFRILSNQKALENIRRVGNHNALVQW